MTPESHYSKEYFGHAVIDGMVNIYLQGLGEFDIDPMLNGPNTSIILVLFLVGTFLLNIVFLNMIIAVMADTYNVV